MLPSLQRNIAPSNRSGFHYNRKFDRQPNEGHPQSHGAIFASSQLDGSHKDGSLQIPQLGDIAQLISL